MIYPKLVPVSLCKTDVHVTIYGEGISEDGEPIKVFEGDLKCNYQDGAKTVLTKEQKLVEISGSALFCGDIAEELAVISDGEVYIKTLYVPKPSNSFYPENTFFPGERQTYGEKRRILKGTKARNPDGTVNFTKLELI